MTAFAAILLFALTRAEMIERLRTPPVTQVDGLVQVYANCPSDMRREYQGPVASFVANICTTLYTAQAMKPIHFKEPGIVVHVGSIRTNVADVVTTVGKRDGGGDFTRIRLPAPGYSDQEALRIAVTKAFFLAVKGETIDDATAVKRLRETDPVLRVADRRAELKRWREQGVFEAEHDDEYYLKLQRSVLAPGSASNEDVANFASRLRLYPEYYGTPFCGRYETLSFEDAIGAAKNDEEVRYTALNKAKELMLYGGGHGDKMTASVLMYGIFLAELARGEKSDEDLRKILGAAEELLKGVTNEDEENDNGQQR